MNRKAIARELVKIAKGISSRHDASKALKRMLKEKEEILNHLANLIAILDNMHLEEYTPGVKDQKLSFEYQQQFNKILKNISSVRRGIKKLLDIVHGY